MSEIDLSLDGIGPLRERLAELEDDVESDAVYVVGDNTSYGVHLEQGTEFFPPYPWFRPAIREFQANPEGFIRDNTGYSSIDEIPTADALVEAVAHALQSQMEANVSAASASDRSPGVHPEHPQVDTGALKASINATRVN